MKSIREEFVKEFGEKCALAIESAAQEHADGINSKNKGSDEFRWAILICIGYQCAEKKEYRSYHGIAPSWRRIKSWVKRSAHLEQHIGDLDYGALMTGIYNEYFPKRKNR